MSKTERFASVGAGVTLLALSRNRNKLAQLAMDGVALGLIARGLTGHCAAYDAMGVRTADGSSSTDPRGPSQRTLRRFRQRLAPYTTTGHRQTGGDVTESVWTSAGAPHPPGRVHPDGDESGTRSRTQSVEPKVTKKDEERSVEQSIAESFPASDPPARVSERHKDPPLPKTH